MQISSDAQFLRRGRGQMSLLEGRIGLVKLSKLGFGVFCHIAGRGGAGTGRRSILLHLLERVVKVLEFILESSHRSSLI